VCCNKVDAEEDRHARAKNHPTAGLGRGSQDPTGSDQGSAGSTGSEGVDSDLPAKVSVRAVSDTNCGRNQEGRNSLRKVKGA